MNNQAKSNTPSNDQSNADLTLRELRNNGIALLLINPETYTRSQKENLAEQHASIHQQFIVNRELLNEQLIQLREELRARGLALIQSIIDIDREQLKSSIKKLSNRLKIQITLGDLSSALQSLEEIIKLRTEWQNIYNKEIFTLDSQELPDHFATSLEIIKQELQLLNDRAKINSRQYAQKIIVDALELKNYLLVDPVLPAAQNTRLLDFLISIIETHWYQFDGYPADEINSLQFELTCIIADHLFWKSPSACSLMFMGYNLKLDDFADLEQELIESLQQFIHIATKPAISLPIFDDVSTPDIRHSKLFKL